MHTEPAGALPASPAARRYRSASVPHTPRRFIELREYEEHDLHLDDGELDSLLAEPSLSVRPLGSSGNVYRVRPGSFVGTFHTPTLSVCIRPKVPVSSLLFLLSYSVDAAKWEQYQFAYDIDDDILEAIAPGYLRLLESLLRSGPISGYRPREESEYTIRGRVRFEDQLRKRFGVVLPAELTYDEFTVDILENRLLRAALFRLLRMRFRSPRVRRRLHELDSALQDVSLVSFHPSSIPDVSFNRLNERYRPAIALARLILSGSGLEARQGRMNSAGFLVDMNRLFENFVFVALSESLKLTPDRLRQGAGVSLDASGRVQMKPDITWWDGGRRVFVGDVKYKRLEDSEVKHHDIYQMLAYLIATDLPGGLLIYAHGDPTAGSYFVSQAGKTIEVVCLSLDGSPKEILADVARVADRVTWWRSRANTGHADSPATWSTLHFVDRSGLRTQRHMRR